MDTEKEGEDLKGRISGGVERERETKSGRFADFPQTIKVQIPKKPLNDQQDYSKTEQEGRVKKK